MNRRTLFPLAALLVVLAAPCVAGTNDPTVLLGEDVPEFSLPSQQGRLVQFKRDYYGKYHLILTFFPAAFTPV